MKKLRNLPTAASTERSATSDDSLSEIRQVIPLLLRARELIMQHVRPVLWKHDLTEQQWRILRALVEEGTCDMRELGRRSQIVPPSLSRTIPNMEQRGLVARAAGGSIPNRALISITSVGLALHREAKAVSDEALERLLRSIDPKVVRKARITISDLVLSINEANETLESIPDKS